MKLINTTMVHVLHFNITIVKYAFKNRVKLLFGTFNNFSCLKI